MIAQRRIESRCASARSDQNRRCPHQETLHPRLPKMRPVKILIRLREHLEQIIKGTFSKNAAYSFKLQQIRNMMRNARKRPLCILRTT